MLIKTYMSVARSFILNYSDKDIFKTILASKKGNLFDNIDNDLKEKIVYLSEFINNHSISELLEEIINVFNIYLKIGSIGDKNLISYKFWNTTFLLSLSIFFIIPQKYSYFEIL